MSERFKSQIAVVTGGASGIGRGIARLFVAEGARVVLADINDKKGERVADELGAERALYVRCDVTREDDIRACIAKTWIASAASTAWSTTLVIPGPLSPSKNWISIFAAMKPGFDEDNKDDLDEVQAFLRTQQPLELAGEPRDIAEAVLYLASDAARFVTGHTLVVDGGSTVGIARNPGEQATESSPTTG